MIQPDKIICCPKCQKKANFTYPFRIISSERRADVERYYPEAEFIPITFAEYCDFSNQQTFSNAGNFFFQTEFFGANEISFTAEKEYYIINIQPKQFRWKEDSRKGLGWVTCLYCSYASQHWYGSTQELYYKIPIGKRYVFAQNRERFIGIRNYFANNGKIGGSPDFDYPKLFYQNRKNIVEKIDEFLKQDLE